MFIEPVPGEGLEKATGEIGWIEVICGAMFSGKTEELIRRLNRAKIAKQKVEIFKPGTDNRYPTGDLVSHDEKSIRSTPVNFANDIPLLAGNCDVVGIDEAQFFDQDIIMVANELANSGKRVIIAGLDMDYKGLPFGPMPGLIAIAEYVTKIHPICIQCGRLAVYSHRLTNEGGKVLIGDKDKYQPLCRNCYNEIMKKS